MMVDTGERVSRGRGFGWGRAVLIASLAVNLLFIGGFARAVWRHQFMHERGLMSFAHHLAEDRREVFRDQVQEGRQKIGPLRDELRNEWTEANKVLGDEPFDKDKFKSYLDKVAESEKRFRSGIYDVIANAAANMTPEERRAFQKWREKRHGRRFRHHAHANKGGDDD